MSGIDIEQTQTVEEKPTVNPDQAKNSPEPDQEKPEFNPELDNEIQVKLQPILLDSAINALGSTMAKLTSLDDMAFTQAEHDALVEAWSPLLPMVSPMTNAVLVTVIIISGKGLLLVAHKRKLKATDKKVNPESKEVQTAIVESPELKKATE